MPKINVEKLQSLTGHKDCLYSIAAGKNKNVIFTSGGDGLVVQWDLENPGVGKMVAKVPNSIFAIHYSKEKHHLLIGHNFEGVHLLDLESKVEQKSAKITSSYIFDLKQIGSIIYCACGDGILVLLHSDDLTVINKIKVSEESLRSLAVNNENSQLAVGCSDNSIYIINVNTLAVEKQILGHTNSVFTVCYHPNGAYLISSGRDAHIKIWGTESYELKEEIVAHLYAINHIVFSPDHSYFASCSMDKSIKIWDAENFRLLKVIDKARHAGHGTSVNKLLWSEDQNRLLSVSDDRSASIWSIQIDN
jgi:WD40 repeat protein